MLFAQAASEVCQSPWAALETGAALAGAGILVFGMFKGLAAFVDAVEGNNRK